MCQDKPRFRAADVHKHGRGWNGKAAWATEAIIPSLGVPVNARLDPCICMAELSRPLPVQHCDGSTVPQWRLYA